MAGMCWGLASNVHSQSVATESLAIRRASEVIEKWSPQQHLYVKGDVGVASQQLQKLESWLDENAPHWTIVLMNNAKNEFYETLEKQKFYGMDAVEVALGNGLSNRTDFGSWVHPQTGETDGAVFVLFLEERKFSYFGSDVHDRRGVGESRWRGNLDREAVRAMRHGGRIIDAVKNTVNLIDGRLKNQLRAEATVAQRKIDAARRARQERMRAINNLKSLIDETSDVELKRVDSGARKVRSDLPAATNSDLANPPIEAWQLKLIDLRKRADDKQLVEASDLHRTQVFRKLNSEIQVVRTEIARYLDLLAAHANFPEMIAPVENRLDAIADHPSGVTAETSGEAYRLLDEAERRHGMGELDFPDLIKQADQLAEQGELAVRRHREQMKQEQERRSLIRKTISIVASLLGAAFLGILWILNIRRRPALRRAHQIFDRRTQEFETQFESLQAINAEKTKIIGSPESFAERNFQGMTRSSGQAILDEVNRLNQMESETRRVFDHAAELIHPSNPIAEAANMFSGARYEHAVNELNGKSFQHTNDQSTNPTWISLDEMFMAYRETAGQITQQLAEFNSSLNRVGSEVEKMESDVDSLVQQEKQLSRAARLDRRFEVPALFDTMIPAIHADLDQAGELQSIDPLQVTSKLVPLAKRKLSEADVVVRAILRMRTELLPKIEKRVSDLKQLGFKTAWVHDALSDLDIRANELIETAAQQGIGDAATDFSGDVDSLSGRAERSVLLANQIQDELKPALGELATNISNAREKLASQLGIPLQSALRESDYDPDVELNAAQRQLDAAKASLNYGGVESALESLEEMNIEAAQAQHLISASLKTLDEFPVIHQQRIEETKSLEKAIEEKAEWVRSFQSRFAPTAWELLDIEPEIRDQKIAPTIETLLSKSRNLSEQVQTSIEQGQSIFKKGNILEAANLHQLVKIEIEQADEYLETIKRHIELMDQLANQNEKSLVQLLQQFQKIESETDHRTQIPTLREKDSIGDRLEQLNVTLTATDRLPDPLSDSNQIEDLRCEVEAFEGMVISDRNAYLETCRARDGASQELRETKRLLDQSAADGIPDSSIIGKGRRDYDDFQRHIDQVTRRLETPNQTWQILDEEAISIHEKSAVLNGQLRSELELAKQSARQLSQAADKVYEAANWSGQYGILVLGHPGSGELENARELLRRGNYRRSLEQSRLAIQQAESGIRAAQAQVDRRRRKLAREAAEQRRRRRKRSSGLTFGANSLGSNTQNSSTSRTRFRSRGNRSSTRSSSSTSSRNASNDSGFSRSGW